uniref:H/ACA ribonucleoprotein complex subunit n=1 Tax=Neogobius melanostomus TaxID=47308 RepID=A0A8C6WP04_9GOBI
MSKIPKYPFNRYLIPYLHNNISQYNISQYHLRGQRFCAGGPDLAPGPDVAYPWFVHPCEDDIVCKCTAEENKVPYFNAPVYLENKEQIGKVDEIFGQIRDFYFSVKLSENMKASSFKKMQKFYIDPMKLLPLQRFLPRPPGEKGPPRGGRGGRGGGRGGKGIGVEKQSLFRLKKKKKSTGCSRAIFTVKVC